MNQNNLPGTGNDTDGMATAAVDQVSSGAHKAVDRAVNAAMPAVESMASGAHQVIDKVAGAAQSAAAGIEHKGEQLHDVQLRFTESCRRYVNEQPVATLGMAVAAGFALSWLLRRR